MTGLLKIAAIGAGTALGAWYLGTLIGPHLPASVKTSKFGTYAPMAAGGAVVAVVLHKVL